MLLSYNHFHHVIPHFNRELKEFYAFVALRGFATSLVGIFIPIYIFQFFNTSISKTFVFFGLGNLLFALLAPLGARIASKLGIKHTILLSTPFLALLYVGYWNINSLGVFIFLLIIASAIFRALYWPAYHMHFARFSDKGKRSSEVGYRTLILSGVAALAPFTGGLIIINFGFPFLFGIVISLLFIATVPLFMSPEVFEKFDADFAQLSREALKKENRRKALSFLAAGAESILPIYIWPIFLFLLAINFDTMGIITSGILIAGMVFAYFWGKFSDKVGPSRTVVFGSFAFYVFSSLQILAYNPFSAFLVGSFKKQAVSSASIPYMALFYEWVGNSKHKMARFIVIREVLINISRSVLLFLFAYMFSVIDPINIKYLFLILSFGALGLPLMRNKNKNPA